MSCQTEKSLTQLEVATFAGGCFWCVQSTLDNLKGVEKTVVGYTGGTDITPTYQEVSTGTTGHTEAIQVFFNPDVISYEVLLESFWQEINPTDLEGQFADRGSQYRPEIFYHTEEQKKSALASKEKLQNSTRFQGQKIAVPISPATTFYLAEEVHQKYYKKNSTHYKLYRKGSGREDYLKKTWK